MGKEVLAPEDLKRRKLEKGLTRIDRLAKLMDDQFELPIIRYRIGLDPIIGVIPGGGDWVTWVVSVYIFWEGARMGAPPKLLLRMGLIATTDLVLGYTPGIGDVIDAIYKANRKNMNLMLEHFGGSRDPATGRITLQPMEPVPKKKRWVSMAIAALLILFLLALSLVPIFVLWWLIRG